MTNTRSGPAAPVFLLFLAAVFLSLVVKLLRPHEPPPPTVLVTESAPQPLKSLARTLAKLPLLHKPTLLLGLIIILLSIAFSITMVTAQTFLIVTHAIPTITPIPSPTLLSTATPPPTFTPTITLTPTE